MRAIILFLLLFAKTYAQDQFILFDGDGDTIHVDMDQISWTGTHYVDSTANIPVDSLCKIRGHVWETYAVDGSYHPEYIVDKEHISYIVQEFAGRSQKCLRCGKKRYYKPPPYKRIIWTILSEYQIVREMTDTVYVDTLEFYEYGDSIYIQRESNK